MVSGIQYRSNRTVRIETCGEVNAMASTWPLCTEAHALIFLFFFFFSKSKHLYPSPARNTHHSAQTEKFFISLCLSGPYLNNFLRGKKKNRLPGCVSFVSSPCFMLLPTPLRSSSSLSPVPFFSSACAFDVSCGSRGRGSPGILN